MCARVSHALPRAAPVRIHRSSALFLGRCARHGSQPSAPGIPARRPPHSSRLKAGSLGERGSTNGPLTSTGAGNTQGHQHVSVTQRSTCRLLRGVACHRGVTVWRSGWSSCWYPHAAPNDDTSGLVICAPIGHPGAAEPRADPDPGPVRDAGAARPRHLRPAAGRRPAARRRGGLARVRACGRGHPRQRPGDRGARLLDVADRR